jgi:hypothetical protein
MELFEPTHGAERPHILTPQMILDDIDRMTALAATPQFEVTYPQLMSEPDEGIPCLIEPFFQRSGMACLAGSSDTGKSTLLRQMALAVAAGDSYFLGFKVHARHRSVIYVSTEDGKDAVRHLVRKQARHYQPDDLKGLRFLFEYEDLIVTLRYNLVKQPADMIIVDCFSDTFGSDLKDTQKIRAFLQPFQHHTGKRTESLTPSKNNLLSGQGLEAKMRMVIELRADLMRPTDRHFCIVKGNYLSSSHKKESHVLHFNEKDFIFTYTGERTPYELLSRQPEHDNSKEKYDRASELKKQGMSYAQIADEMGYSTKSSVHAIFSKAEKMGWGKGEE